MKLKYSITLLLLIGFASSFSQTISVYKINERRSTSDGYFDNKCEIEFIASGDDARRNKFIKISKILTLTDDQGLNLIKDNDSYNLTDIKL